MPGMLRPPVVAMHESVPLAYHLAVSNILIGLGIAYTCYMLLCRLKSLNIWEGRAVKDTVGALDLVNGVKVALDPYLFVDPADLGHN